MMLRGRTKLLTTLAAMLGVCLNTVGCQTGLPPSGPGNSGSMSSVAHPSGTDAAYSPYNGHVQQTGYQQPDSKAPPLAHMPVGPGCGGPAGGDFGPADSVCAHLLG